MYHRLYQKSVVSGLIIHRSALISCCYIYVLPSLGWCVHSIHSAVIKFINTCQLAHSWSWSTEYNSQVLQRLSKLRSTAGPTSATSARQWTAVWPPVIVAVNTRPYCRGLGCHSPSRPTITLALTPSLRRLWRSRWPRNVQVLHRIDSTVDDNTMSTVFIVRSSVWIHVSFTTAMICMHTCIFRLWDKAIIIKKFRCPYKKHV